MKSSAGTADRWAVWFAPAGFLLAVLTAGLLVGIAAAITGAGSDSPELTLFATLAQDGALVAIAIGLASLVGPPTVADFGFVPAPLRRTLALFALGTIAFYALSAVYGAAFSPDGEQNIVQDLGADESVPLLLAAGFLICVVAPYTEELFFRGFFYRSLRNRLGVAGATAVVGGVFGAIHYSGSETVPLLPVLALFGVILCLLYQRTGSLYPAVALHALNNTLALAAATGDTRGALVAAGFGTVTLASCLLAPALQARVRIA